MMKWTVLACSILVCNALFSQIRVEKPVHDLGDIFENSGRVTTNFELFNPYFNDTIRIVDVETSCGCTAILTQDTLIMPRSALKMEVAYDPKGRLGLFVKSIEITSSKTTGGEKSKLFLKLTGNVVAENYTVKKVNKNLVEYKVAPLYFYPITGFDTAYLNFSYITNFINDLTYEIDFYQFVTVGAEIEVANYDQIEQLTHLLTFSQKRLLKGFKKRGYAADVVFFDPPVFKLNTDLPAWAAATIRLHSVNFDAGEEATSQIKVTSDEIIEQNKLLMDYTRFALPEVDEVVESVNLEAIEGKLFLNGEIRLKGMLLMPWKKSEKEKQKFAKKIEKALAKKIEKTTGAGKKEVTITFDSLGVHPKDKFQFLLWDKSDEQGLEKIKYEVIKEKITPPLLPTYRQPYSVNSAIDTGSVLFRQFWANLIKNAVFTDTLSLLNISYVPRITNNSVDSTKENYLKTNQLFSQALCNWYNAETGKQLIIQQKTIRQGMPHLPQSNSEQVAKPNELPYFCLIPLVNQQSNTVVPKANPYMVNFDYYFNGIDTKGWGFQQFANYISAMVVKNGYVELRIESSISKIPIERVTSNLIIAYDRLIESERRLRAEMARKLIDPTRIIFTDERVVEARPGI